jgi:hypothetical protein
MQLESLQSQSRLFLSRIPLLQEYLMKRQFSTELQLIKGTHYSKSDHQSILHFSVNKSATQYVKAIINSCSTASGLANVGIHAYAFKSNFPYLDKLSTEKMQQYQHIFKPKGYTYSVFGGMIDGIKHLDQYLILLMVRDPRDVLVSGYYSEVYSHPSPKHGTEKYDSFIKKRMLAQEVT